VTDRVHNFGAGPGVLPVEVLDEARAALRDFAGTGMGILEISHRSAEFIRAREEAEARLLKLAGADDAWRVLFLQGGASLQFHMVPLNLGADADYVLTGHWSEKALEEAQRLGAPRVAATSAPKHDHIPASLDLRPGAAFTHVTSNNTIYGTQWRALPATLTPLVVDASSDIFSRPLELSRCALVYAGAQKNLGPAGVTVVFIRKALLERSAKKKLPPMLDYAVQAKNDSAYNTCPTFSIFVVGLVARWLETLGGLAALERRSSARAARVYAALDAAPDLYRCHAQKAARSHMNLTWRLPDDATEKRFLAEAERRRMVGLKGHRNVGGIRASLYNALPDASVDALVELLRDFR
jgi:phosphoserine aminotransferase